MTAPTYAISLFPGGRFDTTPQPRTCDWSAIARALTCFQVWEGEKLDGPMWSPARYRDGATRGAAGVVDLSLLVLDVDGGTAPEVMLSLWAGVPRVLHTSWSHTPEAPRFRVVLPLAEPVPVADWPRVWVWAQGRSGGHLDESTKDAPRAYLRPLLREAVMPHEGFAVDFGAAPLAIPWDEIPAPAPPPPLRPWRTPHPSAPEWERRRAACERLKGDPTARAWAAERLGARVTGGFARGVPCPQCGRPSVWWPLQPETLVGCACSHRESCGWTGWLDQLLDTVGTEVTA